MAVVPREELEVLERGVPLRQLWLERGDVGVPRVWHDDVRDARAGLRIGAGRGEEGGEVLQLAALCGERAHG